MHWIQQNRTISNKTEQFLIPSTYSIHLNVTWMRTNNWVANHDFTSFVQILTARSLVLDHLSACIVFLLIFPVFCHFTFDISAFSITRDHYIKSNVNYTFCNEHFNLMTPSVSFIAFMLKCTCAEYWKEFCTFEMQWSTCYFLQFMRNHGKKI